MKAFMRVFLPIFFTVGCFFVLQGCRMLGNFSGDDFQNSAGESLSQNKSLVFDKEPANFGQLEWVSVKSVNPVVAISSGANFLASIAWGENSSSSVNLAQESDRLFLIVPELLPGSYTLLVSSGEERFPIPFSVRENGEISDPESFLRAKLTCLQDTHDLIATDPDALLNMAKQVDTASASINAASAQERMTLAKYVANNPWLFSPTNLNASFRFSTGSQGASRDWQTILKQGVAGIVIGAILGGVATRFNPFAAFSGGVLGGIVGLTGAGLPALDAVFSQAAGAELPPNQTLTPSEIDAKLSSAYGAYRAAYDLCCSRNWTLAAQKDYLVGAQKLLNAWLTYRPTADYVRQLRDLVAGIKNDIATNKWTPKN